MDAPGNSAERMRFTPGNFGLEQCSALLHPLLALLRPLQGLPVVELVEADVRVDLVDGPLPERGHLRRHLAVAGEERHADGVEVVGEELELVGWRAHRCALDGRAPLGAEQRPRLAVTGPPAGWRSCRGSPRAR